VLAHLKNQNYFIFVGALSLHPRFKKIGYGCEFAFYGAMRTALCDIKIKGSVPTTFL
jgi:hypothetical protein